MKLVRPSRGTITSGYGPRSGGVGSTNHKGIDFSWDNGWDIYAAAAGTVEFTGWSGGYGNLTIIRHPLGYTTRYAHQARIGVRKGQKVAGGQKIGVIGNTGTSAGAHLHFELRLFGVPINPTNKFTAPAGTPASPVIDEREYDMRKLYKKQGPDQDGRRHALVGEKTFQTLTLAAAQEEWDLWPGDVHGVDDVVWYRIEARALARRKAAGA